MLFKTLYTKIIILTFLLLGLFSFRNIQSKMDENVAVIDSCSTELEYLYVSSAKFKSYTSGLYQEIFKDNNAPSIKVFEYAYKGYANLVANDLLANKNILTIIDYSMSSNRKRLWVIDLKLRKVVLNEMVAHGRNSGEEIATKFSNNQESYQSSIGFFITGEIYEGKHAESLKLHGMEKRFNDKAFDRGIVIHGAEYVSQEFINNNQRLGRSLGCPAVSTSVNTTLINTIKDGTCLFAFYPQKTYLKLSKLINTDVVIGIPRE